MAIKGQLLIIMCEVQKTDCRFTAKGITGIMQAISNKNFWAYDKYQGTQYKCKHCIGIQIIFHNLVIDDRAKAQPMGHKRKRGTPANVPTALVSL